jgi:hypothetical protein
MKKYQQLAQKLDEFLETCAKTGNTNRESLLKQITTSRIDFGIIIFKAGKKELICPLDNNHKGILQIS